MNLNFQQPIEIASLSPENNFEEKVISFLEEWFSASQTVVVQTSGSTGNPKIFEIEKDKMLASAKMTCDFLGLNPGNSALLCLPVEYISGKMMIVRSIERNLHLHIGNSSLKPLENLFHEIDFCAMTPLQVENSLDKIHLIKNLIIGGAAVSETLKDKITSNLASHTLHLVPKIYETYGMSETLSHIALKEIYPKDEQYFKIFDGIEISQDERSCLKIIAPKLNSEILQTNDIVEIKHPGSAQNTQNEFKFLGRIDNVINSGGAKIFPEELETLVKRYIPNEAIFLGVPDEFLGQKLVLVVELSANSEQQPAISRQLSTVNYQQKFHKPKEIIFIEKIPRTPNGKVDRRKSLDFAIRYFKGIK